MLSLRARRAAALALLAGLSWAGLGCKGPVKVQSHRAGSAAQHIAVAPMRVAARLALPAEQAAVAAEIVAHQLAEALARRGVPVVAPSDVARFFAKSAQSELVALDAPPHPSASGGPRPPLEVARLLAAEFGADAVLFGVLTRWEEREGTGAGAMHAAAVGFEVLLRSAPGGERLWSGNFDHRQKSLGENLLVASRYPGGGTRWLSAPELARWGAGEVARRIPLH